MTSFDARLRVVGQSGLPLGVEVDLTGDHMIVTAAGEPLAEWVWDEIRISASPDGYHIRAEGEEIVLNVTEGARFASELGRRTGNR